jgi:hypothetical protein
MPWKPQFPPISPHPAQAFDFCMAEVLASDGEPVGHVLVFAEPYARSTGQLWWKNLSDPFVTLEFWSEIDGEFDDPFLGSAEEVNAAVERLQRAEWPPWSADDGDEPTYRLRWLDIDESSRVAADVFELDLSAERRRRKRGD